jgi:hypothetical protein
MVKYTATTSEENGANMLRFFLRLAMERKNSAKGGPGAFLVQNGLKKSRAGQMVSVVYFFFL